MSQLKQFRDEIDQFMKHHPSSPLDHDRRHDFDGLNYYEPRQDLILEVEVERFSEDEPIVVMQTSTGDSQEYRRWGHISFEVDGETATLTIYSDALGQEFFMPFKDITNGAETYGAGRYMDNHRPGMHRLSSNRFEIDFNYAYNPYCAYSPHYSCPLPPRDNWLKVPVRAGEKNFK
jgi:uncharacterized protein (DUF1684 family)